MLDLDVFFREEGLVYAINSSKTTQSSLTALKKTYEDNIVSLPKFDALTLDLKSFDWEDNGQDRNWWWQLQSFPFLAHYRGAFDLLNEFERKIYLINCLDSIVNWVHKADDKTPLKWHDHATAFRLRNVLLWMAFCVKNKLNIHLVAEKELLYKFILEHCEWLLSDTNYSKHTNHGFDQAMMLLIASSMLNDSKFIKYAATAERRLLDEIDFAFTEEGVHKENSPGYQKFMYQRLIQLKELDVFGIKGLSNYIEGLIKKTRDFFAAITMPNGMLPMIGDTLFDTTGLFQPSEGIEIYDYSKSGYVVAKGFIKNKDFYFLFKNTHESNYHRHDDDLSIFLYYNGSVLLADGGLGSHNENTIERKSIRSAFNHNCILLDGKKAIRDTALLEKKPIIRFLTQEHFYGESYMFGEKVRRSIDLTQLDKGIIRIENNAFSRNAKVNFISEGAIKVQDNRFCIGDECFLKLRISENSSSTSYFNKHSAFISKSYSNYENLNNFGWNFSTSISFDILLGGEHE